MYLHRTLAANRKQNKTPSLAGAVPELWWTSAVVAAADPPHFKAAVPCFRCPARIRSPLTMTLISRASPHLPPLLGPPL